MNKIIINGDDFGLSESVNDSIGFCIESGVMTSATFLVMRDKTALFHAVEIARELKGKAGFGLHLDLDRFFQFDESGHYGINEGDIIGNYKEIIFEKGAEILSEINHQMQVLLDAGIGITHIDSHHNIHLFPEIYPLITPVLRKNSIKRIRFNEKFYLSEINKSRALDYMKMEGMIFTDYFFDISQLMGDMQLPENGDKTIEIMAHTDDTDNSYGKVDQYNFLLNWDISGFKKISFADL